MFRYVVFSIFCALWQILCTKIILNLFYLIFSRGFSSAQTGSVSLFKSKFEKSTAAPELPNIRQKNITPFRTASVATPSPVVPRSPSPAPTSNTINNTLRKRSPSPVQTGAVNRVRYHWKDHCDRDSITLLSCYITKNTSKKTRLSISKEKTSFIVT